MKKNYMAPQCEQVVLNVSEEILDGHFGNQKWCASRAFNRWFWYSR